MRTAAKSFSNRGERDTCSGERCQGEREVFKGFLGVLGKLRGLSLK
jgi:hypothetical protein